MCIARVDEAEQGLGEFGDTALVASREGGLQYLRARDFRQGCSGISSNTLDAAAPTSSSAAQAEGSDAWKGQGLLVFP
jgi:hypothetical protein